MKVDAKLRKANPDFKGFYTDFPYPLFLKKMVENYVEIMAQMPNVPTREEERVNLDSP